MAQRIQPIDALKDKLPQPRQELEPIVVEPPMNDKKSSSAKPTGSHQDWLAAAGIPQADWDAVNSIISRESSWNPTTWNMGDSGAYGLCQALPAQKMQSAGLDYMDNPVTQLKWCDSYAHERYGSWQAARQFWNANRWW